MIRATGGELGWQAKVRPMAEDATGKVVGSAVSSRLAAQEKACNGRIHESCSCTPGVAQRPADENKELVMPRSGGEVKVRADDGPKGVGFPLDRAAALSKKSTCMPMFWGSCT